MVILKSGDKVTLTNDINALKLYSIPESYAGKTVEISERVKLSPYTNNENQGHIYFCHLAEEPLFNFFMPDKLIQQIEQLNSFCDYQTIRIKYHHPDLIPLERIGGHKSDWIDLRAAEEVTMKAGDLRSISLGVSMELPPDYEAHVLPRSSTPKNFGIIMANNTGIIDNAYCGDNDVWTFVAYAIRPTTIHINDRIAQFRIVNKQPDIVFISVNELGNPDRGGIGSTGKQ